MVPYPFSRGLFLWGAPIWVSREADEAALEAARVELESALNRLTAEAEAEVVATSEKSETGAKGGAC